MDTALTAKRCGGKEVTIVSLETWDEMPAHAWAINQALEEGVKIFNAWGPKRIIVKNGSVSGIEFQRCTRIFDEYGMFNPVYDGTTTRSFDADTIILVIYEIIDTAYLSQSPEIERLRDGRVKVDFVSLETSKKGVFAGGNVVTGPRTAINAIAHGLRAAESIKRYFEGRDLREGRLAEDDKILDEPPFPVAKKARAVIPEIPVSERNGFAEVNLALDEASAREEAQRCLSCRRCLGCRICEEACRPEAIDYSEAPVEQQINVGSVIISTGYDEFDAREMKEFGYGICKNVLTSVEYERVLSATGPTGSIVMRPSDGKIPGKIAFIQCVGSRNKINEYCSAVCCMYATEEAIISREHHHDLEPTIFYMDVRTFGKGYEQHFERARKEYGIKYVKSHISRVMEDNSTGDIDITFMDGKGAVTTGRFDLVVLSVGLRPSKHLGKLADVLGVELNEYGFVKTEPLNSFDASRKGIYVCGCSESPKDITETVIDGLGVATESALPIQGMRWKDIDKVLLPQEKDVNGETPRIGVFICNCGVNIGGIVDVPDVCRYASRLPNVVIADENLFTCSHDTQEKIKKMIDEHRLNRVVVASCSTRTHEPLFRALIRDAGLNKYLFEMANIRDQCSWVHMYEKDDATEKAKTLVRMAVANAGFLEPLRETSVPVHKSALVVGGGVAGMTAALDLAGQGIETCLVEQGDFLGGNLRNIFTTIDGVDIQGFLHDIIENVVKNPFITVKTNTCVAGSSGAKGNFVTELLSKDNACSSLNHGIILIATGGGELKPYGHYRYGEDARIMTQLEFERMIAMQPAKGMNVAMVQCVGSRNEGRPYCSRVCCATAIKNAITLKEKDPETGITIFFRDMMTYGFLEKYYLKARGLDIRFVRFDELSPPVLEESDGLLQMRCVDSSVAEEVSMKADAVVLSSAIIPANNEELSAVFKLPRTREGFFLEAHMKLKPVDFAADGIYMAGVCHSPKSIRESIAQAKGAVARALTILAKDMLEIGGVVARVEGEKCAACLTCVRVCPYSVPVINIKSEAEIDISKCKGCGSCAAECPAKAIDLMHYTDVQLTEKVKALCVGM
jgi:heterodisulfide reductase subunit A-like polyferredoxin